MGIRHKTQQKEQFNSLDQFNSLMTQASQSMSCDSECQRKKTEENLIVFIKIISDFFH